MVKESARSLAELQASVDDRSGLELASPVSFRVGH